MKLGIEWPNTVQETMTIDMKNGNTLWSDAIVKEMIYIQVGFDTKEEGYTPPPGHQAIKYYMIFDVKMEDLQDESFRALSLAQWTTSSELERTRGIRLFN